MNYENEIKALADAQKKVKQQELEAAKNSTLTTIQQEQNTLMPTYEKKRQDANVQSQLGARNFAEFFARRGQTNAGISRQAEASRMNTLGNTINDINTQENQSLQNFSNQRMNAETNYQNNLADAYGNIGLDLQKNLYDEKVRQDELRAKNAEPKNYSNTTIPYQSVLNAIPSGNKMVFNLADGSKLTLDKGINPFTGTINKDLYTKDDVTGKLVYDPSNAFSGGYQPNNYTVETNATTKSNKTAGQNYKVSKTGAVVGYNGQNQNVWKAGDSGEYVVWDGTQNKYIQLTKSEKKSLGL